MYNKAYIPTKNVHNESRFKNIFLYAHIAGPDPGFSVGGGRGPILGGFGLQRGHFSVKMYVKMKELGPVGGRAPGTPPLDPPMHWVLSHL